MQADPHPGNLLLQVTSTCTETFIQSCQNIYSLELLQVPTQLPYICKTLWAQDMAELQE